MNMCIITALQQKTMYPSVRISRGKLKKQSDVTLHIINVCITADHVYQFLILSVLPKSIR